MKVTVTAKELGKSFVDAHMSLWNNDLHSIDVREQIRWWKTQFNARIYGGHFDYPRKSSTDREWNIEDAIVEFQSESSYILFLLEWS